MTDIVQSTNARGQDPTRENKNVNKHGDYESNPINAIFRLDNTLNYYFLKILHDYINYNHNWIFVLKIHIVENGRFPSSSQFIIHFSI